MTWLKKFYKDPGTWIMTVFILGIFPLFDYLSWIVNGRINTFPSDITYFALQFYALVLVIAYLLRNSK